MKNAISKKRFLLVKAANTEQQSPGRNSSIDVSTYSKTCLLVVVRPANPAVPNPSALISGPDSIAGWHAICIC